MRALIPDDASHDDAGDEVDLHEFYATRWVDDGGVRANFVASVDGAATATGLSRGLQTPGDNRVFAALRDLADVVVVGATTATTEGYRPSRPSTARRAIRQRFGLTPAPAIAVMSATLRLDLTAELYSSADHPSPTLIVTGSSAPLGRRNDIIDLAGTNARLQLVEAPSDGEGGVDFAAAMATLAEMGYRRILCEGGPRLFDAGLAAAAVDELCLSVSPKLIGPGALRIVSGEGWRPGFTPALTLAGLLTEDDALFCRYRIAYEPAPD